MRAATWLKNLTPVSSPRSACACRVRETDDPFHVVGIGIAGCCLENEPLSTHACADTASITDATWSTGVISRISFGSRNLRLAFANQKMIGAVVVKPSFQPGNGYDIADSTMLGRTMLRTIPVGGDELLAERLRVGVDVGPTPVRGAFDAEIRQTRPRPDFRSRATARPSASGSSTSRSFFVSRLRASSRKRAVIIASRASSLTRSASFAQSAISWSTENCTPHLGLVVAREVTDDGIALHTAPDRLPATKQVETWTSAGRFIRSQRRSRFACRRRWCAGRRVWVEGDVAGRVDDDVDVVGDRLSFFFAVTEVGLGDVTAFDDDFVVDETFERTAVAFAQWIERRRSDDVVPEP